MERTVRTQRSLSKQEGIEEETDIPSFENVKTQPEQVNGKTQIQSLGSSEEQPVQPAPNASLHRSRSQNKVKLLVRSHAVREETSPPPEPQPEQPKQETRRHKDWQPPLSRGNSREQQFDGANQVDLHQFIVETLNRNHKDRMLLLKIENELVNLANDPKRTMHKFAQMSSYQRMLVHRVAAYFSMEHNVDTSGGAVIVNTTKTTRIPDTRFRDFVRDDLLLPEEPRRSILKRDSSSFDETGSFKFDGEECADDLHWENEDSGVFTNCEQSSHSQRNPRLLKVESYESGDTLRANSLRLSVSKSHSFNGYEPQQQPAQQVQPTRVLTKQDSGSSMSSRISPSSSGYKSQRSDATLSATPSPTATPNLHTQTGQPYTNPDGSIYHYDPNNPPRVVSEGNTGGSQVSTAPQVSQSPAKHGEWRKQSRGAKGKGNGRKRQGGEGLRTPIQASISQDVIVPGGAMTDGFGETVVVPTGGFPVTNGYLVPPPPPPPQVYYIPVQPLPPPPPPLPPPPPPQVFPYVHDDGTTYFLPSPPLAPIDYYNWPLYKDGYSATDNYQGPPQVLDRLY